MPVRRTGPPESVTTALGRVEAGDEARRALTNAHLTASASGALGLSGQGPPSDLERTATSAPAGEDYSGSQWNDGFCPNSGPS